MPKIEFSIWLIKIGPRWHRELANQFGLGNETVIGRDSQNIKCACAVPRRTEPNTKKIGPRYSPSLHIRLPSRRPAASAVATAQSRNLSRPLSGNDHTPFKKGFYPVFRTVDYSPIIYACRIKAPTHSNCAYCTPHTWCTCTAQTARSSTKWYPVRITSEYIKFWKNKPHAGKLPLHAFWAALFW